MCLALRLEVYQPGRRKLIHLAELMKATGEDASWPLHVLLDRGAIALLSGPHGAFVSQHGNELPWFYLLEKNPG